MHSKRFYVKINLQLHEITCPGVWLCAHGYLEATLKMLGYYFRTGAMEPRFPLLCHDRFTMEGYYRSAASVDELERILGAEPVDVTLWQNGRRLAYFHGRLADVLQSGEPKFNCAHNINVQLLMRPSPSFPGILAPKVELSALLNIRNRHARPIKNGASSKLSHDEPFAECAQSLCIRREPLPRPPSSTICLRHPKAEQRRQQPVCHTKYPCGNQSTVLGEPLAVELRRHSMCSSHLSSVVSSAFDTPSPTCEHSSVWSLRNERFQESSPDVALYEFVDAAEHQRNCDLCQSYKKTFLL